MKKDNIKYDWSEKKLNIENNRPLNRWILRLSYLVQLKQRLLISQIALFNQNKLSKKEWYKVFVYLLQSEYNESLIKTILFEKDDIDLLLSNVDKYTLTDAKNKAYNWFKNLPKNYMFQHGIKLDDETFNKILSDSTTNSCGVKMPKPSQEIIQEADNFTKEWFNEIYDKYVKKMKANKIDKSDFHTLLNMFIEAYEFRTTEQLAVTFW
jgi:hypothetical protein